MDHHLGYKFNAPAPSNEMMETFNYLKNIIKFMLLLIQIEAIS